MQPVDNILVQTYKDLQIPTVTLQHGLFVDYEGTYNISSVSYENVVSDYFLSWGESNKQLINKHNPTCNVLVCGNPVLKSGESANSSIFFTVVLDWDIFERENIKMLNLAQLAAEDMKMNFQIRYHPSNNMSKYIVNSSYLINNDLNYMCSKFILGHTSSLIHIAYRLGKTVFKYKSNIPSSPIDKSVIIENHEDIKKFFIKPEVPLNNQIKETINIGPIGSKSLNKYNIFFNGLT